MLYFKDQAEGVTKYKKINKLSKKMKGSKKTMLYSQKNSKGGENMTDINENSHVEDILKNFALDKDELNKSKKLLEQYYNDWSIRHKEKTYKIIDPIVQYCGDMHGRLNQLCRGEVQENSSLVTLIQDLYVTIQEAPKTPKNLKVFRYIDQNEFAIIKNNYDLQKPYIREGFTSCSISSNLSKFLQPPIQNRYGKYIMIIDLPKDTNAIYIHPEIKFVDHSRYELILQKNTKIEINKILIINEEKTVLLCKVLNK